MSSTSFALTPSHAPSTSARLRARLHAHLAVIVAALTLALAWGGLVLTHRPTPLAVPKTIALHAAMSDPGTAQMLASLHWNRYDATAMDRHYEVLGFYRGARMVAAITVGFDGKVAILNVTDLARLKYAFGSNIANDLRMLALLAGVFVLMSAVWPLWRLRNLDVLVIASLALSIVFYNEGRLTAMVLVTYPALVYLALRCAWWALGRRRELAPAIPLYDHLTGRWQPVERLRVLRLVGLALALIVAMVGFTSPHVLDVGYAVMEGATLILHGVLPYGHIPDVLHGDTYPLGSYLMYVPFASLWPVHNAWDDADATLAVAVVAALLAAAGAWRLIGRRSRPDGAEAYSDQSAALRTAIAVLSFPPLLVTVSTGTTDVALAAMLVAVLVLWRRPGWSMSALSAAAWFKAAPAAIVPLLLARLRGSPLRHAIAVVIGTSAVMAAILVALGGVDAPVQMLSAISFQFTRASPHTLWAVVGSVPLQQLAEAATFALIVGAAVRLRRDRSLAEDRARFAALAAAVLLGLQVSANYWTFMYLVWVLPLIALALFADKARPGPAHSPDRG